LRDLRERPLFWTEPEPFSQGFPEEMETESAESEGSNKIRSKADVGLHQVPSFREGDEGYLNFFKFS